MSQPQFEEHNFLLKFNIVIKDGRNTTFKHSNKRISDVAVTEFASVFQIKKMHLCSVQVTEFALVFQITKFFSVAVTELDFVFYNKTVRDISKNIKNQLTLKNPFQLVYPPCIAALIKQKLIMYIPLIKTFKKLN